MILFFVDPKGIKEDAWKHLRDILKIKMAFSFLPDSEVGHLRKHFRGIPFIPISDPITQKAFSEACVYELADYIKDELVDRVHPIDTFADRGKNGLYDLQHFGNENILFFGNCEEDALSLDPFIFQECVFKEEHVNPGRVEYEDVGWGVEEFVFEETVDRTRTDRASALFRHLKNLLVKQLHLEEDIFSKRIKRYFLFTDHLLVQYGPDERTTHYRWGGANKKFKKDFLAYVHRELNRLDPRHYPSTQCEWARLFTHYYDDSGIRAVNYLQSLLPEWRIPEDYIMPVIPRIVDLGLPSGTLWCERNLGAERVSDCGNLYCWGDVLPYRSDKEYKYISESFSLARDHFQNHLDEMIDDNYVLEKGCDAAYFSSNHLMTIPVQEQFMELFEECGWEYISSDGVNGYLFHGKAGNSLFLPIDKTDVENGFTTDYWTMELSTAFDNYIIPGEEMDFALSLALDKDSHNILQKSPDTPSYIRPILIGKGKYLPSRIIGQLAEELYEFVDDQLFTAIFSSEKVFTLDNGIPVVTLIISSDQETVDRLCEDGFVEAAQERLSSTLNLTEVKVWIERQG